MTMITKYEELHWNDVYRIHKGYLSKVDDKKQFINSLSSILFRDTTDIAGDYVDLSLVYKSEQDGPYRPINQLAARSIARSLRTYDKLSEDLEFLLNPRFGNSEVSLAFERHLITSLNDYKGDLASHDVKGNVIEPISLGWRYLVNFNNFNDLINWRIPVTMSTVFVPPPNFPILDFIVAKPKSKSNPPTVYVCQVTLMKHEIKLPRPDNAYRGFFEPQYMADYLKQVEKIQDFQNQKSLQEMLKRLVVPVDQNEEIFDVLIDNLSVEIDDQNEEINADDVEVYYVIISGNEIFDDNEVYLTYLDVNMKNAVKIIYGENLNDLVGVHLIHHLNNKKR